MYELPVPYKTVRVSAQSNQQSNANNEESEGSLLGFGAF
jgi:hypothetical protein